MLVCRHVDESAQSAIDRFGVGEGVHQVRREDDEVRALLKTVVIFPAHSFGPVQLAWSKLVVDLRNRICVLRIHIVPPRLRHGRQ